MGQFIFRRIVYGFLVMLGIITVIFLLFALLPGDSAVMTMGQRSDISSEEAVRKELGLDLSLKTRYVNYLNDISPVSLHSSRNRESVFYFDTNKYNAYFVCKAGKDVMLAVKKPFLGRSYQSKRLVTEMLNEAIPQTALLALTAIFLAILLGLLLGILCAVWKDSWFDRITLVVASMGMALPSFFAAMLFAWIFAFLLSDITGLNMFGSLYTVSDFGDGEHLDIKNLILPAVTLGIRPLATVTELMRNSVLEVISQDYIRTAHAKGLPFYRIVQKHIVKNALNPVITAISGWLAGMMAGAVFVEYVFDYKG
ncbi:MAG: ABC transporter permease, partial [Bacteroidales bacterium]|nr:ABC transporter permease [Bacteroidales bacterium]